MAGTWLYWASWRKFIKTFLLYEIVHVGLYFCWFFLTGVTDIVNPQGSDKDWYLTSWNKYTNKSHVISNHYKSLERFQGKICILIWLHRCTENQIFLRNSFFSNADIHMFLYWFIERLQVNRMHVASFWFYRKLIMKTK